MCRLHTARARAPGARRGASCALLALCVALAGACGAPSEEGATVPGATAAIDAEALVAQLLRAEATEADLAVFAAARADGGACSLDTEESVRLAATYFRRLSEAVVAVEQMDIPTLAAVARILRDEYDAVAGGVEMMPLPVGFESLRDEPFENDRPLSEYVAALRAMLEPYGVGLYVPDPSDATITDTFLPLDLSTPDGPGLAKSTMLMIMEGFAWLPTAAVRAVGFDVYVGDVVLTWDGERESAGYARLRDDGRGVMALDGTGEIWADSVSHEWAHLLQSTCDRRVDEWGDVYFDSLYPARLPSFWASDSLTAAMRAPVTSSGFVLPTFELPSGDVTTVENLVLEDVPDGVAVVELTNYALRDREGFAVHMEEVASPPWWPSHLQVGNVPATEYLQTSPTINKHLAVSAARLDAVAPAAGEMAVIDIMLGVIFSHATLHDLGAEWGSPEFAPLDEAMGYARRSPSPD